VLGEKVRLGIQAPRDVPVFRKEVFLEIQAQNIQAAEASKEALDQALGLMGEADQRNGAPDDEGDEPAASSGSAR
jgi:carbon storage regulator